MSRLRAIVCILSFLSVWPLCAGDGSQATEGISTRQATVALRRLHRFVQTKMTGVDGAIFVNAVSDRPSVVGEARNHELLSETVGQRMELALLEKDRATFEKQLALAKNVFVGK